MTTPSTIMPMNSATDHAVNTTTEISMAWMDAPPADWSPNDINRCEAQEMWVHRVDVTDSGLPKVTLCRDIGFGSAVITEATLEATSGNDCQKNSIGINPGDRVIQWRSNDVAKLCPSTPSNRETLKPSPATLQGERKHTALPRKGMHVHTLNLSTLESRQNHVTATSTADAIDQIQERLYRQDMLNDIEVIAVAPMQTKITGGKIMAGAPLELSILMIDDDGFAHVVGFRPVDPSHSHSAAANMTPLIVAMTPGPHDLTLCNQQFPRIAAAMEARKQHEMLNENTEHDREPERCGC